MRIISIDIGMNNFAAITNNIGKEPNLIRGKTLKAENQWYNKITQPLRQQLMILNNGKNWVIILISLPNKLLSIYLNIFGRLVNGLLLTVLRIE